jgi:type IV secretory pathway TrbD component
MSVLERKLLNAAGICLAMALAAGLILAFTDWWLAGGVGLWCLALALVFACLANSERNYDAALAEFEAACANDPEIG